MKFGFVKIGSITPKIRVADVEYNAQSIIDGISQGEKKGVELLVFPELCITGYTCGDLFYSQTLLSGAINSLKKIADYTVGKKMLIFVGLPFRKGNLIFNVAAAINDGKVKAFIPKTYLPNYNEFYEKRHFAPCEDENTVVTFDGYEVPFGKKIILKDHENSSFTVAAELCEDLWTATPPSVSHALSGANIIVNLSCSDETIGKAEYRRNLITSQSAKLVCAYVYADAGDGESTTDMVFAGHNMLTENGRILAETKLFENALICADTDVEFLTNERAKLFNQPFKKDGGYIFIPFNANSNLDIERSFDKTPFVPLESKELNSRAELILNMQAEGLKKRIEHTRAQVAVIGLSGGLDSTLALIVAVTAMKKLGRNLKDVVVVTMPCFGTTSRTYNNTIALAKAFKVTLRKVDITKSVTRHLKDLKHPLDAFDVTFENAQARERTQVLMDTANMLGGLVVGTGDLSELALGWATYNGDHMSMYAVNTSVPKTLVKHLVNYYAERSKGKLKAVLKDILDTPVSPELLPAKDDKITQKTEDIVGPYILHDFFLYHTLRNGYSPLKTYYIALKTFKEEFDEKTVAKWLKNFIYRFFSQQFKRTCIPDGVKIGSVTLSPRGDWRMPTDAVSSLWLKELENI